MSNIGRIVFDETGTIVEADEDFAVMMRNRRSMIGVNALAITAPADRDRCVGLLAKICADGEPIVTTKRMMRHDGSHLWVRNTLVSIGGAGDCRIEASLVASLPPPGWVVPARLLEVARLVFASRRGQAASFGTALFGDHAWDLLLCAYICEAEGSVVTIARAHAWAGIPLSTGSRWIRALSAEGLLEYEDSGNHELVTTPFRLTSAAHAKFETYLSELCENAAGGAEVTLA